ncbi:hypothetical protein HWV62_6743 [Athelia sp. TMB]|nr:hypothetical protein HWV62_6743 [Athelia sp. TMB]
MPQRLPPNPFNGNTLSREHSAYATCLRYEAEATAGSHPVLSGLESIVLARVLGYLIIYAPTELGRANISHDVASCDTTEKLADMAKLYVAAFIRCCKRLMPFLLHASSSLLFLVKSAKGPTSAPSSHPSGPSSDNVTDAFLHTLLEAPQNYQKSKALALHRDNYRCVITGYLDTVTYVNRADVAAEWEDAAASDPYMRVEATHCAHIFPECFNEENEGGHKHSHAASIWAAIARFGQVRGAEELAGPLVHRIENVMTMSSSLHQSFDSLMIWFEATPTLNQYNVRSIKPGILKGVQNPITLPTNHNIPAPDPRYLKLHAACAQIAHLSGAAEYISSVERELEETGVLATDVSVRAVVNVPLCSSEVAEGFLPVEAYAALGRLGARVALFWVLPGPGDGLDGLQGLRAENMAGGRGAFGACDAAGLGGAD